MEVMLCVLRAAVGGTGTEGCGPLKRRSAVHPLSYRPMKFSRQDSPAQSLHIYTLVIFRPSFLSSGASYRLLVFRLPAPILFKPVEIVSIYLASLMSLRCMGASMSSQCLGNISEQEQQK